MHPHPQRNLSLSATLLRTAASAVNALLANFFTLMEFEDCAAILVVLMEFEDHVILHLR